ncbi:MAG: hypothetical protein QXV11_05395 [Desulfurococcaceae archaeon]
MIIIISKSLLECDVNIQGVDGFSTVYVFSGLIIISKVSFIHEIDKDALTLPLLISDMFNTRPEYISADPKISTKGLNSPGNRVTCVEKVLFSSNSMLAMKAEGIANTIKVMAIINIILLYNS